MPEHAHEHTIGVLRIDEDGGNLLAVAQAEVPPALTAVGRFVDAVAGGQVWALQALAAADVDDVGIRRGYGEGADGAGRLVIEDGCPGMAEVGGLPDSAIVDADIEDVRLGRDAGRR